MLDEDPDLAGPWKRLFQQVQRPRQVLSELLQNADDAGATWARARIRDGVFVFEHDGADFDEADFSSLCSFGFSRKRLLHTIGFWGVGFKSLFSLGPRVEVVTPTLACFFNQQRFTEPVWIEDAPDVGQVTIRVMIEDDLREEAIRQEFGRWCASPLPLALFRRLRCIELADQRLEILSEKAGPVPLRTRILKIGTADAATEVLVISSQEEEFPQDAIAEVRDERADAESLELPPATVTVMIALDAQDFDHRIYTVLPTEERLQLSLSCDAPFVPDPGRTGIKPSPLSPTNRWLLGRVGQLVGETLIEWLHQSRLSREERAQAYQLLLPELAPTAGSPLSDADRLISDAFEECIEDEALALDTDGQLGARGESVVLSRAVVRTWGPSEALSLFAPHHKRLLAPEVSTDARKGLEARGYVESVSREDVLSRLSDPQAPRPPRPAQLELLVELWAYIAQGLSKWEAQRLYIFPAADSDVLHRPDEVAYVCERPDRCPEDDWDMLMRHVTAVDQQWVELVRQAQRHKRRFRQTVKDVTGYPVTAEGAEDVAGLAEAAGLSSPCRFADLLARAASRVFGGKRIDEIDEAAGIRLLHTAFRCDVGQLPQAKVWRFKCRDGRWRPATAVLVDAWAHLLPPSFASEHVLSKGYYTGLSEHEAERFRTWLTAQKGCGLTEFPMPEKHIEYPGYRDGLGSWISERGGELPDDYQFHYRSEAFRCYTYVWPRELVAYWDEQSAQDPTVWASVLEAVLGCSWIADERIRSSEAEECGYTLAREIAAGPLISDWLLVLRERACIRGEDGQVHQPGEVHRRTSATESIARSLGSRVVLLPSDWERPDLDWLWDALGVQKAFSQYEWVLDRIRALARAENPPIHHLAELYELLEGMWPDLSPDQEKAVREAVAQEPLVWTDYGWCAGSDCFQSNPDDIPGQPVIHHELAACEALWDSLGIAEAPTAESALQWLEGLPLAKQVLCADVRRVERILARYAADALQRTRAWLDVNNYWVAVTDLCWACGDPGLADGLTKNVRGRCARFDMVPAEQRAELLQRAELRDLGQCLKGRKVGGDEQGEIPDASLSLLGDTLARLAENGDYPDAIASDREVGMRLKVSRCVRVSGLRVRWFADGDPASAIEPGLAVWEDDHLYVEGSLAKAAKAAVNEICRHLRTDQAREFVGHCLARPRKWIQEYATENLELEPHPRPVGAPELPDESLSTEESEESSPPDEVSRIGQGISDDGPVGAEEQGLGTDTTETLTEQPGEGLPSRPRVPGTGSRRRADGLAGYFRGKGFLEHSGQYRFRHPDGRVIRHEQKGPFPYVESKDGEDVRWYYVAENSLDSGRGVEVPADTWELGRHRGDAAVLLVPRPSGGFDGFTWSSLQAQLNNKRIALHIASYRIRPLASDDSGASVT